MRLTLRTLLAYLDDTLEPAQAKLIGQKISESPTAQELVERIKEVMRRRRLTTPPSTGPAAKLDANTVAEYIDSVLPAEELAAVEEVCLEADVYLAEVAACHQILTVILSQPALVPPTARQRMYGLIQGREAIPYRKAARAPAADGSPHEPLGETDEADETLLLGLPLFSRHGAWFRRLAPLAGVLLLAVALAATVWQLLPGRHGVDKTGNDTAVAQGPSAAQGASTAADKPQQGADTARSPAGANGGKNEDESKKSGNAKDDGAKGGSGAGGPGGAAVKPLMSRPNPTPTLRRRLRIPRPQRRPGRWSSPNGAAKQGACRAGQVPVAVAAHHECVAAAPS
jgi:hypothetical protein